MRTNNQHRLLWLKTYVLWYCLFFTAGAVAYSHWHLLHGWSSVICDAAMISTLGTFLMRGGALSK